MCIPLEWRKVERVKKKPYLAASCLAKHLWVEVAALSRVHPAGWL